MRSGRSLESLVSTGGYVPRIDVGDGRTVLLTEITGSPVSRAKYLEPLHREGKPAVCLCRTGGVPMGVAKRQTPAGPTYYLYPLHRGDPLLHSGICPHFFVPQRREEGDLSDELLSRVNGRLRVKIDVPVKKLPPRKAKGPEGTEDAGGVEPGVTEEEEVPEPVPQEEEAPAAPLEEGEGEGENDEELQAALEADSDPYLTGSEAPPPERVMARVKEPPITDLRLLLHVLWNEADLVAWDPRFDGKRWYGVVAARLAAAATHIDVKGAHLGPLFYVPPPYAPDRAAECEAAWQAFARALRPDHKGNRWYGYVLGLLRDVELVRDDTVCLRFRHTARAVWMEARRFAKRLKRDLGTAQVQRVLDEAIVVVLAQVLREEGRRGPWLRGMDLAAMRVVDEDTWLPVWEPHEVLLLDRLRGEGRRFYRPLRGVHGDAPPAFVLLDRKDRTALEVVSAEALGGAEEAARYRETRAAAYEEEHQAVWWWDEEETPEIPPLPPADAV